MRKPLGLLCAALLLLTLAACGETAAESGESGKTVVTVACSYDFSESDQWVAWCAEQLPDIQLEIVDYKYDEDGNERTPDARRALLREQLEAGTAPDIICYASMGLTDEEITTWLADLYPWLDADETLSRESISQNVRDGLELDGGLYAAVSAYSVQTFACLSTTYEACSEWTYEQLDTLLDSASGCGICTDVDRGVLDAQDTFDALKLLSYSSFFDYEARTARFDSDEFRAMLELCARADGSLDGSTLVSICLSSYQDYETAESILGGDVTWAGAPGEGAYAALVNPLREFGLNAASENSEAAWACLRLLFTEEFQYEAYVDSRSNFFPTNARALERLAEECEAAASEGVEVPYAQRNTQTISTQTPVPAEEVEKINQLLSKAVWETESDSNAYILMEKAIASIPASFFNGELDAEAASTAIQSAAEAVLAEK